MRRSRTLLRSVVIASGFALAAACVVFSAGQAMAFGASHATFRSGGTVGTGHGTFGSSRFTATKSISTTKTNAGRNIDSSRRPKSVQISTGGRRPGDGTRNPHPPRHPRGPIRPLGPVIVPLTPVVGNAQPLIVNGAKQNLPNGPIVRRGGASGIPAGAERRYVPDEVVVELANGSSEQAASTLARRHRLARLQSLSFRLAGTTFLRWKITDRRSVPTVVRALQAESGVLSVQPNYLALLQQDAAVAAAPPEGDPAQYALAKLNLPRAHAVARGEKISIAVIDSGIDAAHPELAGVIADSYDPVGAKEPGSADKTHAHGTGVAGAIAAHARLMGAAPAAKILAVRAFDAKRGTAQGTTFNILAGLDWAAARGARIINMSFAGPQDPAIARSLSAAHAKGIILVAAAGNAGPSSPPLFPASDPNVIAVTATDAQDDLFSAANRGSHIAVAAPGVDILLPAPNAGYQLASGTSFAAAEVSGAIALLLERKADLDPAAVRRILTESAKDLGPGGADPLFGAGLVDAYRAVISLQPATAEAGLQTAIGPQDLGDKIIGAGP